MLVDMFSTILLNATAYVARERVHTTSRHILSTPYGACSINETLLNNLWINRTSWAALVGSPQRLVHNTMLK